MLRAPERCLEWGWGYWKKTFVPIVWVAVSALLIGNGGQGLREGWS